MTEQEWLDCIEPKPMLEYLRGSYRRARRLRVAHRKFGLFACACYHRLASKLGPGDLHLIEVYERYTDRRAKWSTVVRAYWKSIAEDSVQKSRDEANVVRFVTWANPGEHFGPPDQPDGLVERLARCESAEENPDALAMTWQAQAVLLRDVFGPLPFRSITIDPAWRSTDVTGMAQAIYDERAFDRLPILADALEDAGCDNADILNHCRQPGVHVRGCWCVNLILDKT